MRLINQREENIRRTVILAGVVLMALASLISEANAQNGTILVGGGAQTLNITTSLLGAEPTPVTNTSSTLQYWKKNKIAKVTVATACPGQSFNLAVVATGVTYGVAAPSVNLTNGMLAVDFITSIPRTGTWTSATVTLSYTASATFSQGNSAELGDDVHTVTYTLVVQ
jgi:hypothetical protein